MMLRRRCFWVTAWEADCTRQVFRADGPTSGVMLGIVCQSPPSRSSMSPDLGHTFLFAGHCPFLWVLSSQKRNHFLLQVLWRWKFGALLTILDNPITPQYYNPPYKTRTWQNGPGIPTLTNTFLVAQMVKSLPAMRKTQVWSLGWEDTLENEVATHSRTLAWKIPWTEEPGRLQSMEAAKSWTQLSDFAFTFQSSGGQRTRVCVC